MLELLPKEHKFSLKAFHQSWKSLLNVLFVFQKLHFVYALQLVKIPNKLFVLYNFAFFFVMIAAGLAYKRIVYIAHCAYADLLAAVLHI